MFDKLDDILIRLEEILNELNEPTVANDTARFQKLMKEQSDLQPIADAYREYKNCKQTVEDSLKSQTRRCARCSKKNSQTPRSVLRSWSAS